jgi:hypothetical protein
MAKRGNGEGSIYYRNADSKWVGSVTLGSGKRKVFYGKTRKEVQEKLKIVLHDQQQGTLVTSAPQTVAQFLTDWLENTHRRRLPPAPMNATGRPSTCISFPVSGMSSCRS